MLRFCGGSERGDVELTNKGKKHSKNNEEGKRYYSCTENLFNFAADYCSSGIHGIQFFEENRTFPEKVFWTVSIALSIYLCIISIVNTYTRWDTTPVIVSFATKETPVWMIPFPAVTICPVSKTKSSLFNYTYYLHKKQDNESLTDDEERKFGYLSFICDTRPKVTYKSFKFTDESMFVFLEKVQPNFYENAFDCKYLRKRYNCSDLFVPIVVDDGICYIFNIMDRSQIFSNIVYHHKHFHRTTISDDWSIENGYDSQAGVDAYPRRALSAGIPYALEVKLKVNVDDLDYTCGTSVKGFKVQVTHPQRLPRVKHQHFIVPLDKVVKAGIAPDMMTTSQDIKLYNPLKRNCHLASERKLKYFRSYTQNNCVIECRANFTISQCGCVTFYVPREKDTPICGAESHRCLQNAIRKLQLGSIQKKLNTENKNKLFDNVDEIPDCQCLPLCTSIYYNIETTQADYDWRSSFKYDRNNKVNISDQRIKISLLQVFLKRDQFITSERNELYGFTEFLANVGGLLGLFIGFSVLSLVEIGYYLTLRIWCNIVMFGRGNWAGKTDS